MRSQWVAFPEFGVLPTKRHQWVMPKPPLFEVHGQYKPLEARCASPRCGSLHLTSAWTKAVTTMTLLRAVMRIVHTWGCSELSLVVNDKPKQAQPAHFRLGDAWYALMVYETIFYIDHTTICQGTTIDPVLALS